MTTTTDFFTRCLKSAKGLSRFCAPAFIAFALAFSPAVRASEGIEVKDARLELTDDGWQLSADFDIQFTPTLREAVDRGVALYFIIEFDVRQPRWYWLDKKNVAVTRERRIAYAPLTQLSSLRGWAVAGKDSLKPGESYEASLRMRLDTSMLPKPFQISAVASNDWTLASDWRRWTVAP
jgi:Domain of unknown function (DUF4390)